MIVGKKKKKIQVLANDCLSLGKCVCVTNECLPVFSPLFTTIRCLPNFEIDICAYNINLYF